MLSLAKDSFKNTPNFYLYKKSFNYVSSLSSNIAQRINEADSQKSPLQNVADQLKNDNSNSKLNNRHGSLKKQNTIDTWPTAGSIRYRESDLKEVQHSAIEMLLASFLKTSLVDKHGALLPKRIRYFNSIHLQMLHDISEDHSKLPGTLFNRIRQIDRNKPDNSPASRIPPKEEFSLGSVSGPKFLCIKSMKYPLTIHSSGFHTSAASPIFTNVGNKASIDSKLDGTPRKQNSLVKNEDHEIDDTSEEFDFPIRHGKGIESNGRFDENEFGNYQFERKTGALETGNNIHRKSGGGLGRRHTKRQTQVSSSSHKEGQSEDTPTPESAVFNQEKMEKVFPDPRNVMNRIYSIVCSELKDPKQKPITNVESVVVHKKLRHWQCTIKVLWPSELRFSATGRIKSVATSNAALKCLHYLLVNGKLENGLPMLYDSDEIKDIISKPAKIEVKSVTIDKVSQLLDWYNKEIVQLLSSSETEINETVAPEIDLVDRHKDIYEEEGNDLLPINDLISSSDNLSDPLRGTPLMQHSSVTLNKRDMEMYHNLKARDLNKQNNLPIMDYRYD